MSHELDATDLDAIRELRVSHGNALYATRIMDQIKLRQIQLEAPASEDRTNFLRGEIAGLRTALQIPEILENEAKSNVEGRHEKETAQRAR